MRTGPRICRLILALLAAVALAATGCGGGSSGGGSSSSGSATTTVTTTTTTTAPPTTTTTTSPGIDTMPGASTRPVVVPATSQKTALLTEVRAARHEGFDRIVFTFSNVVPGYDVRYVAPPVRQDGSGKLVPVAGAQILRIRMENALDADLTKPGAPMTYTGPRRFDPGTPEIAELVQAGGFEGVLTWAAGLRDRVDFRVTTLTAPARVVVDVRNH